MLYQLLQLATGAISTAPPATAVHTTTESISLLGLLAKGGFIMYPLYVLLLLTIFTFFERWIAVGRASKMDANFMHIIRDNILSGNVVSARNYSRNVATPIARMVDKGLQRLDKPIESIEKSMENVGRLEMYNMERNLSILSLVAGIAPMFGFLGTIIGMVQLFYGIASTGEYTLNTIAGGIYTKMVTSASGLIIGMIAYMGHTFLNSKIDKVVNKMESVSTEFIDTLLEPVEPAK